MERLFQRNKSENRLREESLGFDKGELPFDKEEITLKPKSISLNQAKITNDLDAGYVSFFNSQLGIVMGEYLVTNIKGKAKMLVYNCLNREVKIEIPTFEIQSFLDNRLMNNNQGQSTTVEQKDGALRESVSNNKERSSIIAQEKVMEYGGENTDRKQSRAITQGKDPRYESVITDLYQFGTDMRNGNIITNINTDHERCDTIIEEENVIRLRHDSMNL